jgi:pentatricopeptide repeat protein
LPQVFEEMTNEGVKPNFVTYNSVMDAYAKSNDYEGALAWLEKMQRDGVAPNVVTYTTLINACGRAGRLEEAARILDEAGESVNVVSAEPSDHNPCANRVEVQRQGARAGAGSNVNVVRSALEALLSGEVDLNAQHF